MVQILLLLDIYPKKISQRIFIVILSYSINLTCDNPSIKNLTFKLIK